MADKIGAGDRKAVHQIVSAFVLPLLAFGFVIFERCGLFDWYFGHDAVLEVESRLETSYAAGVDRQVGPDEKAWKPLLRLIQKYSTATLREDKEPKVFARYVAVASGKIDNNSKVVAEWTAPSTPIVLDYRSVPGHGQTASLDEFQIVGSIGDIRLWVDRSRADLRFWVQDISLAFFSRALGLLIWTREFPGKWKSFTERLSRKLLRR